MATVSDFVKDFSPREREALDAALHTGERVRWAVRPLCRVELRELPTIAIGEVVALSFMVSSVILECMLFLHPPSASLTVQLLVFGFFALFFFAGVLFALLPLWEYRRRCRTLYLLTNHRALVLTPGKLSAFPLHENMLRSRICRPGGSGDLLFAGDEGEEGFLRLPDLLAAHIQLNAAINDLLDAAERHLGNRCA